jgi:hypothetical protein
MVARCYCALIQIGAMFVFLALSAGCMRHSVLGETCGATNDCVSPLRCVASTCVATRDVDPEQTQFDTIEQFAASLLEMVKSRDRGRFDSWLLPKQDCMNLLALVPKIRQARIEPICSRMQSSRARRYHRLQQQLVGSGVDIDRLQYEGIMPNKVVDLGEISGFEKDLQVQVRANDGSRWVIDVEEVVRWRSKWVLVDPEVEFEPARDSRRRRSDSRREESTTSAP